MVMPEMLPSVAGPIVRPVSVTLMLAMSGSVPVEITIDVEVDLVIMPVAPEFISTPNFIVLTKNSDGKLSVMSLPISSFPMSVVVKQKVAEAPVLPATRSAFNITNEVLETCDRHGQKSKIRVKRTELGEDGATREYALLRVPSPS